ncbi:MAG: 16S rRNA (uracil(1498)-N(3))-methyltransferase [Bacteroidota bacterium]
MHIFYEPSITNEIIVLNPVESLHCCKVLRLGSGSKASVIDGKGNLFDCTIIENNPKKCILKIEKSHLEFTKRNYYLHIAIAPTKSIERFEWFLEKATEIGIDEITPILCDRSERKIIKEERLNKILVSAMKQSLNALLPKLNPMINFSNFISDDDKSKNKYIAHCESGQNNHIKSSVEPKTKNLILIGPEGDFSPAEIKKANEMNYKNLYLGINRYRTETAGIIACQTMNFINS